MNSTAIRPLIRSMFLALVLLALPLHWTPAGASDATMPAPGASSLESAVIIRFETDAQDGGSLSVAQQKELDQAGATGSVKWLGAPGEFRVEVNAGMNVSAVAKTLSGFDDVTFAEPDRLIRLNDSIANLDAVPESGSTASESWALDAIEAKPAWDIGTGQGVVVAVLDTGVSASHPDLAGRVLPGWNFVQNNDNAADDAGHGTFVAGLIAGVASTGREGVAPGASILPVKILDSSGVGSTASFVAGINYAVSSGARVINISASGATDSGALDDALANAEAHGVVVVASVGNDATEQTVFPAAVTTVLAVSAIDRQDKIASFSTFGPYVDLAAPGVDIWSSWWTPGGGDSHTTASGSSASAPLVSGAAAVIAGLLPDAPAAQVRAILTGSARDVATPGIDGQTGYGLVDAVDAARMASPPAAFGSATVSLTMMEDGDHLTFSAAGFNVVDPIRLWTRSSDGYAINRSLSADSNGRLVADLGPAWRYPEGSVEIFAWGIDSAHAASASFDIATDPVADPFKPVPEVPSTPDRSFFAASGHTLSYGFKQYWETHGGVAVFGYPISEEFSEKSPDSGQTYTVQYFERYRFEFHPEFAGSPAMISLGRLGVQTAAQTFPTAMPSSTAGMLYFDATHHTLAGQFKSYWESHGGLELFGYPTSEPFEQGGLLVQYFERARFELHPELSSGAQVLLSRLGVVLAREDGYVR